MRIEVKHSCIIIHDYEMGLCPKLEKIFSVWDSLRHCHTVKTIYYDEETSKLYIPRGVDIPYIENLLNCFSDMNTKCNPYDKVSETGMKFMPRDNDQKRAIAFMLGARDYAYTKSKSQIQVNLLMGKGKTYCSIAASAYMQMRTAIIPCVGLIEQWRDCILEYTDVRPNEIYEITGTPSIHRILSKDSIDQYKYFLVSPDTLRSYAAKYGWYKITELFEYLKIGLKIFDEYHLKFGIVAMIDYHTNVYKTIYLSGTPNRSDKEEDRIFQLYFKSIPRIDLFDQSEDPHTRYIALKYNSRPTPFDIDNCKNMKGFQKNSYASYIVQKPQFYQLLNIILDLAIRVNGKVLFFIAKIESLETVYQWVVEEYPELKDDIGIYHSKIPASIKEKQLDKKFIFTTMKSMGTGKDIKGLKMTVNLAEPVSSPVLTKQALYRTRDNNTMYIDCIDIGFKSISRYYTDNLTSTFNIYALSTSLITYNERELLENSDKALAKRRLRLTPKNKYRDIVKVSTESVLRDIVYISDPHTLKDIVRIVPRE